jgi:serine phosphatase RsbU (regulator of sigma subunit)/PAS domain-containing protein
MGERATGETVPEPVRGADRDAGEERLAFLASAGPRLLASARDSGRVLELIAELVVPELADYCSVREIDTAGVVRRVALRFTDPAKASVIETLSRYPPWSDGLLATAMREGRAFLAREIDPERLEHLAVDAVHLDALRALDPHSLVGVPVLARGRTVGVIVACNAGPGRQFGEADVALFEDLARRAGLAIESALAFEEEHARRAQAETARAQAETAQAQAETAQARAELARAAAEKAQADLGFLLEVSTLLSSSLDFGVALQRLSQLAASWLCDLCLVDLLEADGSITRVAATAADPAQQPLADLLRERYPPLASGEHPAARVMRTGNPEFAPEMSPDFLETTTRSDEHRRLTSALAFRSYVAVPLAARGRILGCLTLVATARSGRRYGESELALASDLARRAALALDNARLFQQTEFQAALLDTQAQATIEGVLVVSPGGSIVSFNRQFAELWSVPEEILKSGDADRVLAWVAGQVTDSERFRRRVLELRRSRDEARDQIQLLDGRVFDRWSVPLVGRDANSYGRAFYFRDVTDLRQAQEERSRLYEAERVARLEAERSGARLAFLLEASTLLAASLDPVADLPSLADLIARTLADRCLLDVMSSSGLVRVSAGRGRRRIAAGGPLSSEGLPAVVMGRLRPLVLPPPAGTGDPSGRHGEGDDPGSDLAASGVGSYLGVPVLARGRLLGCLSLVRDARTGRRYDGDDVALAEDLARRIGLALDHARLFDGQRHIARTLQASLLPPKLPDVPGIELAARYRPAFDTTEVGGDFYDVFPAGAGAWAVAIGDISGKGIEAAALTALARYTVRAAAREHRQPREVLSLLNEAVLAEGPEGRFLTVAFGRLRHRAGGVRLTVASGGHPLPLLLRSGGSVEPAGRPGTLMGFTETVHLPEKVTELRPGDTVVFFTDGLTDVRGPEGMFGEERLMAVLRGCSGLTAEATAARLEAEVLAFLQGEPRDDLAVVVLRVQETLDAMP